MTGELAQLSALVTYGNARLRGIELDVAKVEDNFGFEHSEVRFALYARSGGFGSEQDVADTGTTWINWLAGQHCVGIRLFLEPASGRDSKIPEHIAVAFAGAGPSGLYRLVLPQTRSGGPALRD